MADTRTYDHHLEERVRASTSDELKCLIGFFDCAPLRVRYADLLLALQSELARRGLSFP